MDALLRVLFFIAATPCAAAAFVLIRYSPKPLTTGDDIDGYARIAVVGGAVFGIACTFNGWVPPWHVVLFAAGISMLIARRARQVHQVAVEHYARRLAEQGNEVEEHA